MVGQSMNHASGAMQPRALTEKERSFTRWLIEHGCATEEKKSRFLRQLEQATVIRKCPCGCASIDFAISGHEPATGHGIAPFGDFLALDHSYGVFVFHAAGMLAGVEIYSLGDLDTPAEFPGPDDLEQADWKDTANLRVDPTSVHAHRNSGGSSGG